MNFGGDRGSCESVVWKKNRQERLSELRCPSIPPLPVCILKYKHCFCYKRVFGQRWPFPAVSSCPHSDGRPLGAGTVPPNAPSRVRPGLAAAPSCAPAAPRAPPAGRRLSLGAARSRGSSLGLNMAAALRGGREVLGTPVEVSAGRGHLPRAGGTTGTRGPSGLRPDLLRPRGEAGTNGAGGLAGRGLLGQARAGRGPVRGAAAPAGNPRWAALSRRAAAAAPVPWGPAPALNFPGRAGASGGCPPVVWHRSPASPLGTSENWQSGSSEV